MARVTVVPADRLIIVDGYALCFEYAAPDGMHALQWDGEGGHIEWLGSEKNPPHNEVLDADSYADLVAPYVKAWEEENARQEQAAAEAEAAWPSTTARRPASSACAPSVTGVLPPRITC